MHRSSLRVGKHREHSLPRSPTSHKSQQQKAALSGSRWPRRWRPEALSLREALFGGVRPRCVSSVTTPLHAAQPSPAQQPGAESLAEGKAERPSLLPAFTNRPLWGCQAPGQGPGCGTADFCLVLMLADSPGQPCEHHPTRYLGGRLSRQGRL